MSRGSARTAELALLVFVAACLAVLAAYVVARWFEPVVPKCAEDEVVTQELTCTHPDVGTWEGGYWHGAGLIPPLVIEKGDK